MLMREQQSSSVLYPCPRIFRIFDIFDTFHRRKAPLPVHRERGWDEGDSWEGALNKFAVAENATERR